MHYNVVNFSVLDMQTSVITTSAEMGLLTYFEHNVMITACIISYRVHGIDILRLTYDSSVADKNVLNLIYGLGQHQPIYWLFTGFVLLSASISNWRSLYTDLCTALHLDTCLTFFAVLLTCRLVVVYGRRPPTNLMCARRVS